MSQGGIALLIVAFLSALFKDYILAAAAGGLCLLTLALNKSVLASSAKPVFSIGIFFLMLFILMPVATERVKLSDLTGELKNPFFFLAVAVAAAVSHFGGRGVAFMQQPSILFAMVLGTLIGVLFFRGLPAGLIIAAGIVSVAARILAH